MKMVWKVIDTKYKVVATFPFPEEEAANAKAAKLTASRGEEYRVKSAKVSATE